MDEGEHVSLRTWRGATERWVLTSNSEGLTTAPPCLPLRHSFLLTVGWP